MDTINIFKTVLSMELFSDSYTCFDKFMEYGIKQGDIRLVKYLNERFNKWIDPRTRFDLACLADEYEEWEIKEYLCLELEEHLRPE
jgi:hypothetical protein